MRRSSTRRDRAVVLGGGMACLLAARSLADHFAEVVIVDRDELGPELEMRRGVPQGRHTHALLAHGRDLLERLFPGLTDELVTAGAPTGDMLADTDLCFGGYRFARGQSGLAMVSVTRPVLERAVRRRVAAFPGVAFYGGRDVVGLLTECDRLRVRGVRVYGRADGSAEEELGADLVVEATGRGSRLPAFLAGLGLPARPRMGSRSGSATPGGDTGSTPTPSAESWWRSPDPPLTDRGAAPYRWSRAATGCSP